MEGTGTPMESRRSVVSRTRKCQGKNGAGEWRANDTYVTALCAYQLMRARMMSTRPTRKQPNTAAISLEEAAGASRNSFQMKTTHQTGSNVAPRPNPKEITKPARPRGMTLEP